jgi:hypothetical protein
MVLKSIRRKHKVVLSTLTSEVKLLKPYLTKYMVIHEKTTMKISITKIEDLDKTLLDKKFCKNLPMMNLF